MHLAPLAGIETTIRLHIGCIASILDAFWVWVEKISAMHTTNEKLTQALGYCPGQKNYRSSAAWKEAEKNASNNDVGIIAGKLLFCTTPCFEALTYVTRTIKIQVCIFSAKSQKKSAAEEAAE